MPEAEIVGIVGTGAMGQGIAQVAVTGGMRALLLDAREGAAETARDAIGSRLDRQIEKGRMDGSAASAAMKRLEVVSDVSALADCTLVVEAIVEDLDAKRVLFEELEGVVSPDCLLASNTSSLPIASIARGREHRGRIAGLHFFNPVPLMKLVEVIQAAETTDATAERLVEIGKRMGRTPVVVKDSPGFLVNLGGRAFSTEALRIVHEGVAEPHQVDAIMRDCFHFRMGPFELLDLTGMDVNYPVSRIVHEGFMGDARLETTPSHKAMLDAGMLGRKSGRGWFDYEDGKAVGVPSPDHETSAEPADRVLLADPEDEVLGRFAESLGLDALADDDGRSPILAAPVGADATHTAVDGELDHERLVCLDLSGDVEHRITIMTPPGGDPAARDAVAAALIASGRKVTAISDSPGFVGQRIVAMIANLGCYMAERGLASPRDVDTAMRLGLNYPKGPLQMAEDAGPDWVMQVLEELQELTGEARYRPTLWLRRRAALGLPIHTPA